MDNIRDYIYREERYGAHFSLVVVSSEDNFEIDVETLKKELRETDKVISLCPDLLYVVFDEAKNHSYLKAAENLNKTLQKIHFQKVFFLSTADSEEFDKNYLDMTNKLFERLEYAIKHKLHNTIVYQDYII
jgi:hypothetical protein